MAKVDETSYTLGHDFGYAEGREQGYCEGWEQASSEYERTIARLKTEIYELEAQVAVLSRRVSQ